MLRWTHDIISWLCKSNGNSPCHKKFDFSDFFVNLNYMEILKKKTYLNYNKKWFLDILGGW